MTTDPFDRMRDMWERQRKAPLEEAEKAYHDEGIEYFKEQRALIDEQKKYTRAIKWATIMMAIATAVIAFFAALQYFQSSKINEAIEKSQLPILQAPTRTK
jgi:uncharacterized membrane protein YukC